MELGRFESAPVNWQRAKNIRPMIDRYNSQYEYWNDQNRDELENCYDDRNLK